MSDRSIEDILDEFVRTYVTFRPVKCETVGHSLRWTFEPVIHETPVPPEDMTIYNTGDGVQSKLDTWGVTTGRGAPYRITVSEGARWGSTALGGASARFWGLLVGLGNAANRAWSPRAHAKAASTLSRAGAKAKTCPSCELRSACRPFKNPTA